MSMALTDVISVDSLERLIEEIRTMPAAKPTPLEIFFHALVWHTLCTLKPCVHIQRYPLPTHPPFQSSFTVWTLSGTALICISIATFACSGFVFLPLACAHHPK